ncbi:hypothetical protein [Tenacibaculum jejuense]|uniref:Transporter n=1 Tax=Tenacibaculum jejuense TaxID=584609 RepID=A0A238UEX3_9FLAO|nr:hypothetical protein [Tenacibaculum jejuense]SNR17546.1 conserved exported protein of unknown function [Tenacibaculum jejuense]
MKRISILLALFTFSSFVFSQEENQEEEKNNLQVFTPSKLLNKGQWDIKWFNGLYTQTRETGQNNSEGSDVARSNFFTSTLEVFTGISDNNRINVGAIVEFRSNTFGGRQALSVFSLEDTPTNRVGFSSIAPSVKIQPFENVGNFSIQSAIHIPLLGSGDESNPDGGFLDQTAWSFQNRFFYDYTFPSGKWQLFTELNTEYGFGDDKSFANNTFLVVPGAFISYFPTQKATVLAFAQHSERFGDFEQDNTSLGFGGKYQLTDVINLEVLYSNIVRGFNFQGLGETYSFGIRALF